MSAYIPTNVISITDGQIFLETELFNSGIMPAVNPGISVSRVGGDAQIKATRRRWLAPSKLLYSQYRELQSFAQFGSDLDADTKSRLALGERIVDVLKQKNGSPKEVAAGVHHLRRDPRISTPIPVAQIPEFEKRLEEHMNNHHADVLEAIRSTGKLETETENALKAALDELVAEFQA